MRALLRSRHFGAEKATRYLVVAIFFAVSVFTGCRSLKQAVYRGQNMEKKGGKNKFRRPVHRQQLRGGNRH